MLSDGRIPSDVQTLSPSPNKSIRNMMGQGEATPHTFRYGSASFSGAPCLLTRRFEIPVGGSVSV